MNKYTTNILSKEKFYNLDNYKELSNNIDRLISSLKEDNKVNALDID